jgi:methionyl-tRNA formyltransferase
MTPLRIVFAGTPQFSVPTFQALALSGHELLAVYTQPDRPAGRGRQLTASPVKEVALELGIPVHQPASLKPREERDRLQALAPDLIVVVAYGLLLPKAILDIPRLGCLNVHASLLPRWRGAAPIQRALLAGDIRTGISLMRMETGLDTGPVYAYAEIAIGPRDTSADLHDRLATLGADALIRHLPAIAAGNLAPVPQDEQGVCYAAKLAKLEAGLDWRRDAVELERQIRGLNPWPVAETHAQGQVLRIWQAQVLASSESPSPAGKVIAVSPQGVDVATGDGVLRLTVLQKSGGRALPASDFIRGFDLLGQTLGG